MNILLSEHRIKLIAWQHFQRHGNDVRKAQAGSGDGQMQSRSRVRQHNCGWIQCCSVRVSCADRSIETANLRLTIDLRRMGRRRQSVRYGVPKQCDARLTRSMTEPHRLRNLCVAVPVHWSRIWADMPNLKPARHDFGILITTLRLLCLQNHPCRINWNLALGKSTVAVLM